MSSTESMLNKMIRWRNRRIDESIRLKRMEEAVCLAQAAQQLAPTVPSDAPLSEQVQRYLTTQFDPYQFRRIRPGHGRDCYVFDACSQSILIDRLPTKFQPPALHCLLAVTAYLKALRRQAADALGLSTDMIDFLSEGYVEHGELVGRGLHIAERMATEVFLATWHARAPEIRLAGMSKATNRLALCYLADPSAIMSDALDDRGMHEWRRSIFLQRLENARESYGPTRLLTERDAWDVIFPEGAPVFEKERGSIIL